MAAPWYCTREDVKAALDWKETARNNVQVDRVIDATSRAIEGELLRKFYPTTATRTFDWPNQTYARAWRLWLDEDELVSATTLVSGGVTIPPANYLLRPDTGPPYTCVEIDRSTSSAFASGSTAQRSISIVGKYGASADTRSGGVTAEALDSSETRVDVSDSFAIGVGDLIKVDDEQMVVTEKAMLTTGQTLQTPVTASAADVTIAVSDGTTFSIGEMILLDSERMKVVDIAGNNLTVKRAFDGSALAAHTGSTIYAPRTCVVVRGAVGTTAATHSSGVDVAVNLVPSTIRSLCVAQSTLNLVNEVVGYIRLIGSGSTEREPTGEAVEALWARARQAYGRQFRKRAI